MSADSIVPNIVVVQADGVRVEATFDHPLESMGLTIRYVVRNTGETDMAVFDRGNGFAADNSGAPATPEFQEDSHGDLCLIHRASPLPRPTPTIPQLPLAVRLEARKQMAAEFTFDWGVLSADPKRVRWCLSVAVFDTPHYGDPKEITNGLQIWRASFAVVESQKMLCTPWFDLHAQRFETN